MTIRGYLSKPKRPREQEVWETLVLSVWWRCLVTLTVGLTSCMASFFAEATRLRKYKYESNAVGVHYLGSRWGTMWPCWERVDVDYVTMLGTCRCGLCDHAGNVSMWTMWPCWERVDVDYVTMLVTCRWGTVTMLGTCRCGSCYAGNKYAIMDRAVLVKCVSLWIMMCW